MIVRIALIAWLVGGCTGPGQAPGPVSPGTDPTPVGSERLGGEAPTGSVAATSLPMPPGFPVHGSMDAIEPDGTYIAAWQGDALPPVLYDFYLAELPAAGYVIDLEGPGGEAAIIRFTSPQGIAYQLDLTGHDPVKVALGAPHD